VILSSSDSSTATVPPALTVPEGAERATFPIATQSISGDREVVIAASAPGTSANVRLGVWPPLSGGTTTFRFASQAGDYVGGGQAKRLEQSSNIRFGDDMWGGNSSLQMHLETTDRKVWWSLTMTAPGGQPLVPGVYRDARRIPPIGSNNPTLTVYGEGRGCNASTGEFEVLEAVYGPKPAGSGTTGTIERFRARFSQVCSESPDGGLVGDVVLVSIQRGCKMSGNC
jgi:hypothetical protein